MKIDHYIFIFIIFFFFKMKKVFFAKSSSTFRSPFRNEMLEHLQNVTKSDTCCYYQYINVLSSN